MQKKGARMLNGKRNHAKHRQGKHQRIDEDNSLYPEQASIRNNEAQPLQNQRARTFTIPKTKRELTKSKKAAHRRVFSITGRTNTNAFKVKHLSEAHQHFLAQGLYNAIERLIYERYKKEHN